MQQEDSPRKAIFRWLARAENNATQPDFPNLTSSHELEDPINENAKSREPNVATKLKLHTPFRQLEEHARGRNSKREAVYQKKRNLSSEQTADRLKRGERVSKRNRRAQQFLESSTSSSDHCNEHITDENCQETVEDHVATTHPYERRRRRKTKEDRYVLKEKSNERRRTDNRGKKVEEKGRKGHKRREKTGAALLHGFNAANVAPERLTLKHPSKVGLFTKGRASSPYRKRALPDLSFSELRFHNSHQDEREEPSKKFDRTRDRIRTQKSLEQNQEFSKFFTSKHSPLHTKSNDRLNLKPRGGEILHTSRSSRTQSKIHLSSTPQPSLPPIDFPGRPFLGFGKRAPHSGSPMRRLEDARPDSTPVKGKGKAMNSFTHSQIMWSQSPVTPRTRAKRLEVTDGKELRDPQHKSQQILSSETTRQAKLVRNPNEVIPEDPPLLESVDAKRTHVAKSIHSEKGSNIPINITGDNERETEARDELSRETRPLENEDKRSKNVGSSKRQEQGVNLTTGQENSFMSELGQLLRKWNRKEVPVGTKPIFRTEGVTRDASQVEIDETHHTETALNRAEQQINDANIHTQEANPTVEVVEDPRFKDPICDKKLQHMDELYIHHESHPSVINDTLDTPRQHSRHREDILVSAKQDHLIPDYRHLMPFPNTHASHSGPSLFMSPESIYARQMYEQEARPRTARFTKPVYQYSPSSGLGQRPQSRATLRPSSRSFLRPLSRPFSRRYGLGSEYNAILANEEQLSPQIHYRTPSLSNLSAAERVNAYSTSTPGEPSRFFAVSEPQLPEASCYAEDYQEETQSSIHLATDITPYSANWQEANRFEPLNDDIAVAPENVEAFSHPPTRSLGVPYHHDMENTAAEQALSEASREQRHIETAICPEAGPSNELAEFPAGFWTPNRLY